MSYRRVLWVSPLVLPSWGVARLGGMGAPLRSCVTVPPFSFFLLGWRVCARGWVGFPPFDVFFWGGFACSSLCPPWGVVRTGRQTVWLTWSLLALRLAAGRALAPCVVWLMYTHGLAACPVGLGSDFAGSAVAPASFVWSWVRGVGLASVPPPLPTLFGGDGLNFPVAVCAGGPPLAGGQGVRQVFPASPLGGGRLYRCSCGGP